MSLICPNVFSFEEKQHQHYYMQNNKILLRHVDNLFNELPKHKNIQINLKTSQEKKTLCYSMQTYRMQTTNFSLRHVYYLVFELPQNQAQEVLKYSTCKTRNMLRQK